MWAKEDFQRIREWYKRQAQGLRLDVRMYSTKLFWDIISQGHLPGVIPPCVCRHVARKLQYCWAWIQLHHVLRVAGREAAQPDGCHHFCACQGLTERRAVALTPSSVNLCWQVVSTHQDLTTSMQICAARRLPPPALLEMLALVFPGGEQTGTEQSRSAPTSEPQLDLDRQSAE